MAMELSRPDGSSKLTAIDVDASTIAPSHNYIGHINEHLFPSAFDLASHENGLSFCLITSTRAPKIVELQSCLRALLYISLAVKKDGSNLHNLSPPKIYAVSVSEGGVHEAIWYGCVDWLGIEIWTRVRGKKKQAKEAAVKIFCTRYSDEEIKKIARDLTRSRRTAQDSLACQRRKEGRSFARRDRIIAGKTKEPKLAARHESAQGSALPKEYAKGPAALQSVSLEYSGAIVLIDGMEYMNVAETLWSAAAAKKLIGKIAEVIVYCAPEFRGVLPAICTVRQIDSQVKDARITMMIIDLARRIHEFKKRDGLGSSSRGRQGRLTAVYLAMREKFAKPLLDILRREYVVSVHVQSGEQLLHEISASSYTTKHC